MNLGKSGRTGVGEPGWGAARAEPGQPRAAQSWVRERLAPAAKLECKAVNVEEDRLSLEGLQQGCTVVRFAASS